MFRYVYNRIVYILYIIYTQTNNDITNNDTDLDRTSML